MSDLLATLAARAAAGRPLRVGLIGAGPFGAQFLAQARRVAGLHVLGVADRSPQRVRTALLRAGWPEAQFAAASLAAALATGTTHVGDDAAALIAAGGLDVLVEAGDSPAAGVAHALLAVDVGRQIIMANRAADALCGPILARRAAEAGLVYSLAYGGRPALLAEQVAWARACGFAVVAAGLGVDARPQDAAGPAGTLAAIELASVANACGLRPQPAGLRFPPCGADDLAHVCRPLADGGQLAHAGTVEAVAAIEPDGRPVHRSLRGGVFVIVAAPDDYIRSCFAELGLPSDESGRYAALTRPAHLAGLELTAGVLRAGLRGEPSGAPVAFCADVAAVAGAGLADGQALDAADGVMLRGHLLPAADSLAQGCLPLGLAHGLRLRRAVAAGAPLRWDDVLYETTNPTVRMRRLMERTCLAEGR